MISQEQGLFRKLTLAYFFGLRVTDHTSGSMSCCSIWEWVAVEKVTRTGHSVCRSRHHSLRRRSSEGVGLVRLQDCTNQERASRTYRSRCNLNKTAYKSAIGCLHSHSILYGRGEVVFTKDAAIESMLVGWTLRLALASVVLLALPLFPLAVTDPPSGHHPMSLAS